MKNLRLYLETSIFNFAFADDAPKEKEITLKLFAEIDQYEVYISEVVIGEINKAPQGKKDQLLDLIGKHDFDELAFDEQSKILSDRYIKEGMIPQKY